MNTDDVTTGKSAEMKMDCPVCGGKGTATYTTQTHELAYFGEVVESTIQCEKCGFRHNDILATEQKDPAKHSLIITKKSLDSRVVRSQSATVSLPEVGIKVEPGPKSEGYISNVADGASVHEYRIGFVERITHTITGHLHDRCHHFTIGYIHLATVRLDKEFLVVGR